MAQGNKHIALTLIDQKGTNAPSNYVLKSSILSHKGEIEFQQFKPQLISYVERESSPMPFTLRNNPSTTPLLIIYFITLVIWATLYRKNNRDFIMFFKNFTDNNTFIKSINDKNGINGIVTLAFFLLGISSISTFIYLSGFTPKSILFQENHFDSPLAILFISFAIMIWFFLKTIIISGTSVLFQTKESLNTYLSLNIISLQILGIVLLPISILISYGPSINPLILLGLGILLISLFFMYRLIRAFSLAVKQTNSQWFHILLYICTLEILPLLPLSKLLNW